MLWFCLFSCGDTPCTKIGCTDVLTIEILPWDFYFGNGFYQIQIVGDDQSFHDCTIQISTNTPECEEGGDCVVESTCNASYTSDTWTFMIEEAPELVSINVFKDDVNYLSMETTAIYEEISPNGPDCGPTCLVGETLSYHLIH